MSYPLNHDFLIGQPELKSLRQAFGSGLTNVAAKDDRIVTLSADLASSVGVGDFADQLPDRFVETGIGEQDLVTIASGMARVGKIPFAASYAAFSPGRNWEQIRTTIALNDQPVKLVGSHTGLNVGPDGATHQMLEDIALMRVLPNMVVLAPGDAVEAERMAGLMAQNERPNYIRLPREKYPVFSTPDSPLQIGKSYLLRQDDGAVLSIISTGSMTANALRASEVLSGRGVMSEVVHVPTIKPLDRDTILNSVGRTSITVTVEEHQVAGGLGSAVAEIILESNIRPTVFHRIGVNDQFGQSGTASQLMEHYRLDVDGIVSQVSRLLDY